MTDTEIIPTDIDLEIPDPDHHELVEAVGDATAFQKMQKAQEVLEKTVRQLLRYTSNHPNSDVTVPGRLLAALRQDLDRLTQSRSDTGVVQAFNVDALATLWAYAAERNLRASMSLGRAVVLTISGGESCSSVSVQLELEHLAAGVSILTAVANFVPWNQSRSSMYRGFAGSRGVQVEAAEGLSTLVVSSGFGPDFVKLICDKLCEMGYHAVPKGGLKYQNRAHGLEGRAAGLLEDKSE